MNRRGVFRRRHLPHWDLPGAIYFVTACLQGSVSDEEGAELARLRRRWMDERGRGGGRRGEEARQRYIEGFKTIDGHWDRAPRVRLLERPDLAREVRKSLYHFSGLRYFVLEYVLMPSHLHWVFQPTPEYEATFPDDERTPREAILQSLKSYTGRRCNELLERSGQFWQQESYDHWARDDRELYWICEYVRENPVRAGLAATPEEYEFSSAHDRKRWGIAEGLSLRPPEGAEV
jgi:type I restriction enzyme R subunit